MRWIAWTVTLACAIACGGATEPPRVRLPIEVDGAALGEEETDLGYRVRLTGARAVIGDIKLTIAGEQHVASLWQRLDRLLVPRAMAHPGHYQGGEVVGELLGRFVVDWVEGDGAVLGEAVLLPGTYTAGNFGLLRGDPDLDDDLGALAGHTAVLTGEATRSGQTTSFEVVIDSPEGRELVGAPLELTVGEGTRAALGLQLTPSDPLEGGHLFDGVDFAALPANGDVVRVTGAATGALGTVYDEIRRRFQTHDHFRFSVRPITETE